MSMYSQNTPKFTQAQIVSSVGAAHYKYITYPPKLPPEIDRAIDRGSYTKRMSLIADRAIVAAELRYELEFGGAYHG
jgi:hypothetical protein